VRLALTDARATVLSELTRQSLLENLTVADLVVKPDAMRRLERVVDSARQIGGPRRIDARTVEVRIELSGRDVAPLLLTLAAERPQVGETNMSTLQARLRVWDHKLFQATGSNASRTDAPASVEVETAPPVQRRLPAVAPAWVTQQMDASASAPFAGSPLRSARDAETRARAQLHEQVRALPLTQDQSIRQAIESDPQLAAAIDRALRFARVSKTDYQSDGSVVVKISMELRDVWGEVSFNQ